MRAIFVHRKAERMSGSMITLERLPEILRMFGIDMSEWGNPGRRDVGDLFATMQRREGYLHINADGIALGLQTARAFIQNGKGECLIVGWKNLRGTDNSDLNVASLPGGKLAENEDPHSALKRELLEELGLSTPDYTVRGCETKKGSPVIRALPNLPARRTDYIFTVHLRKDHPYLAVPSFEREEHGRIALFRWVPETEWSEKEQKQRPAIHQN